ncbi:phage head-tail adapter protein [Fusobacterium polymorphum]
MKEILKNIKLGQIIGIYHFEDSCFTVGKILKINSKYLFLLSYDINFKEDGIKVFLVDSIKRIILKSDYMRNLEKIQKKIVRFNSKNKDIFQELIENKIKISIDLKDGSIEEAYLTEKGENYFSFQILNDNENITSEEVIAKAYLKRIKISNFIEREEYKKFKIITTKNDDEYMAYDLFYNGDYLIFSEKEEFYDTSEINIIPKNIIKNISDLEVKLNIKRENFYNNLEKGLEILEILKKCYENKFLVFIDNEDFFETKAGIIANLEDNKIKMKEIDKYGNFHKNSEIYFDEIQLLVVKNYKFMEGNHEEKF